MPQPNPNHSNRFTYADYLTWSDDERWEIVDGVAYAMSPSPGRRHQQISKLLGRQIDAYLSDKSCEMYYAPFDVRFVETEDSDSDEYIDTVVQPDIIVVCDLEKLDEKGCKGSPDLIIEILSPSTARMDMTIKFDLYQRHGVKEYWIIHPVEMTLLIYRLNETGLYGTPFRYVKGDRVPVPLLGELVVDLGEVFADCTSIS